MANPLAITIRISPGEMIDRLTILEIKAEHIDDETKLVNIRRELEELAAVAEKAIPENDVVEKLRAELKDVNDKLWDIEDDIRDCERKGDFGPVFVSLARAVYRTNDERAALKRRINDALGADIAEEKSYTPY
ncbi:MAG TPA: DUF6165 family protein [Alphaproteobacteria bacterium]|jgi:predicted  nucleic acid-binding Zn-ribbon protein